MFKSVFAGKVVRCLTVLALTAFIWFMLRHLVDGLIYSPMKYPEGDWQSGSALGAHDVWFHASDGRKLHAWWFPRDGARFVVLFLHGNAGNVTQRLDHAEALLSAGAAVLLVDYRGYGKSEGKPDEGGLYLDAKAGYDELLRLGFAADRIIIQGESLGSAVAVELASRQRCAGLILEAPFSSLSEMAGTIVPMLGPLLIHGFHNLARIRNVHVPLLVIHGDADEIVPFSQGRAVFEAAQEPKRFWTVRGAHHNDLLEVAGAEYGARVAAFFASLQSSVLAQ